MIIDKSFQGLTKLSDIKGSAAVGGVSGLGIGSGLYVLGRKHRKIFNKDMKRFNEAGGRIGALTKTLNEGFSAKRVKDIRDILMQKKQNITKMDKNLQTLIKNKSKGNIFSKIKKYPEYWGDKLNVDWAKSDYTMWKNKARKYFTKRKEFKDALKKEVEQSGVFIKRMTKHKRLARLANIKLIPGLAALGAATGVGIAIAKRRKKR